MKNIKEWVDKHNCTGCSACYNICPVGAIKMEPNKKGFLEPIIDSKKCINCGKCQKVCMGYNKIIKTKTNEYYIARNKDEEVVFNSSSGGIFSILANYILDNKGSVYGAILDKNLKVKHVRVTKKKDLNPLRRSKYTQSILGNIFQNIKQDLESGLRVLFVGTPCQAYGLKLYTSNIKNKDNLLIVDIICHGTPSPLLFHDHIKFIEKKSGKKLKYHYFRTKERGWRGHIEKDVFTDGTYDNTSLNSQTFREVFYTDKGLKDSCYSCLFSNLERSSDITIGDCWGIENTDSKLNDNKGSSIVIVSSIKAKEIFNKLKKEMITENVDINKVLQKNLKMPTPKPDGVDQFWSDYYKKGYTYIVRKYTFNNNKYKLKQLIKKTGIVKLIRGNSNE